MIIGKLILRSMGGDIVRKLSNNFNGEIHFDRFVDTELYDLLELNEMGLSNEEISKELTIPKQHVEILLNDIRKNI